MQTRLPAFRPHLLAVAMAAASTAFSAYALAAERIISTPSTQDEYWTDGDLTVTSTGSIIPTASNDAIYGAGFGTLGTLTNHGTINGRSQNGLNNLGSIPLLVNTGFMAGTTAIYNSGTIESLDNSGFLTGMHGIRNFGTIGQLLNSGTITSQVSDPSARAILNSDNDVITTLTNTGLIHGAQQAIENRGVINTLSNAGTISGDIAGISGTGFSRLDTLINSGTISAPSAIKIAGAIPELTNTATGVIEGTLIPGRWSGGIEYQLLANDTSPAPIVNNSGLISGESVALGITYIKDPTAPGRTLGVLNNSGTIAGPLVTSAMTLSSGSLGPVDDPLSHPFIIHGGQNGNQGTIIGLNRSVGEIYSYSSALIFRSGSLLLNSHIIAGLPPSAGSAGLPPAPPVVVINEGATVRVDTQIRVAGSYQQNTGAGLRIGVADSAIATGDLDNDAGYGRLVVADAATLAPGSSVTLQKTGASYAFAPGQRYVVVDASEVGTAYHADALRYGLDGADYGISGAAVTSAGRSKLVLSLTAQPGSVDPTDPTDPGTPGEPSVPTIPPNPATQPNAHAALEGLARYTGVDNDDLLNLYNAGQALRLGGADDANRAGDQLSPANASSLGRAAHAATLQVFDLLSARHDALRAGQAGGTGVASGEAGPSRGAWGQAFGGHARQDLRDDVSGYTADFGGLMLGLDRAIGQRWRAGGALSYSNTQVDFKDTLAGNTSRIDSYGLLGYTSYTADAWYADLSAGVFAQRYRVKRNVGFTGFSGNSRGKLDGQQYLIRAEAGYPINLGRAIVTPLAALNYTYLRQDGYTETGGNGAALSVRSASLSSITSDLGVKASRSFATSRGLLTPSLQLAWRHEYRDKKVATHASFAGDPTGQTAFSVLGARPMQDAALLSAGLTLHASDTFSVSARYDLQAGGGFLSQGGSLRLRQLF